MKDFATTKAWHSVLATLLVAIIAALACAHVTRGFRAVTADGVRRIDLADSPRPLPAIPLVDSMGKTSLLSDLSAHGSHLTLVTLMYTRCMTICRASASGQAYLQQEILARGLEDRVKLLTLSFDPHSDSPEVLAAYARRLKADTRTWNFATVADGNDLPALLKLFDIVVIPDGLGGYAHNAALFLVDREARVARAYDIDRPDAALADLLAGPSM